MNGNDNSLKPELVFHQPWKKQDKRAHWLIWLFCVIVFAVVSVLDRSHTKLDPGFNPHVFALINAWVNSIVSLLLLTAYFLVKRKQWELHRKCMLAAMALSVIFLLGYIAHHVCCGPTYYGDLNHDGQLNMEEKNLAGSLRWVYYILISTHITLAGLVMPFVLYSAYRALTGEYAKHKKLVRYTFPIWLYVSVTGVLVYMLISPYYQ